MATNGGTKPVGPRCIALVGPFQSGKTTLLEAILARTGAIPRQGTVEAGSTVGDGSKEARHHRMGVELSVATTTFLGESYTFIDCPGSVEFIHDMRASLPAIDAAGDRDVVFTFKNGTTRAFTGKSLLLTFSLPQFFFHVTTAYDILRHAGVDLVKKDFLGPPR